MEHFTLQATGWPEIKVHGRLLGASTQYVDEIKRGVEVKLYERATNGPHEGLPYIGVVTYLTKWPTERNFCRVFQHMTEEQLHEQLRTAAKTVLPPGAGYPATAIYHERQRKLQGQLETLTLDALSFAIRQSQHGR